MGSGVSSNRYANSATKIIFVRLARGPFPRPSYLSNAKTSSIREFSSRPNVLLCDEHAFESLERPELFGDAVHLNRYGAQRFSRMLAERIGAMLKPLD
jgi:lysophospholipase L1-like esterase